MIFELNDVVRLVGSSIGSVAVPSVNGLISSSSMSGIGSVVGGMLMRRQIAELVVDNGEPRPLHEYVQPVVPSSSQFWVVLHVLL